MTPRSLLRILALGLALSASGAALAERPTRSEVIDEVVRFTGLTNDTVSLALGDAKLLGRLTDAVLAVQVAQRFLDARDADIAADIAADVLNQLTDTTAEALLPPPLVTAIKAVRIYKSMLEAARDYVFIPVLDEGLYRAFRANRDQHQDVINSFSYAVSQSLGGGYFSVKPKMIEDYIGKYKGWDKDLIGEPMCRRAERQVDRFWMARLEARYQQEKAAAKKQDIVVAIWAGAGDALDQLKAAAGGDDRLFIDPARDLPGGWWWVKDGVRRDWNWGRAICPAWRVRAASASS